MCHGRKLFDLQSLNQNEKANYKSRHKKFKFKSVYFCHCEPSDIYITWMFSTNQLNETHFEIQCGKERTKKTNMKRNSKLPKMK